MSLPYRYCAFLMGLRGMTANPSENQELTLDQLFPAGGKTLLTGTGKQFIERIGLEAVREVVLAVMLGENVRTHTEPLTRRRITQISGALVAMFANGWLYTENFTEELSKLALQQLTTRKRRGADKTSTWLANWAIGLTGKSDQNVVGKRSSRILDYIADFEQAIERAAEQCRADIGDIRMTLGYVEDLQGRKIELNWKDIARLTTAIGSATLTIRGSEKSMYGKLFERLILGSFLTILGFQRVDPTTNTRTRNVFWLSDSSDLRESDATLLLRPGKLARFDMGFIGPGNSEISKDKLSRFARKIETAGSSHSSVTFVVVDRLPSTLTTQQAAEQIGAEIIQMSMQYWPRELAQKLGARLGLQHELQKMRDEQMHAYLQTKLSDIPIQDFLTGVSIAQLQEEPGNYVTGKSSG